MYHGIRDDLGGSVDDKRVTSSESDEFSSRPESKGNAEKEFGPTNVNKLYSYETHEWAANKLLAGSQLHRLFDYRKRDKCKFLMDRNFTSEFIPNPEKISLRAGLENMRVVLSESCNSDSSSESSARRSVGTEENSWTESEILRMNPTRVVEELEMMFLNKNEERNSDPEEVVENLLTESVSFDTGPEIDQISGTGQQREQHCPAGEGNKRVSQASPPRSSEVMNGTKLGINCPVCRKVFDRLTEFEQHVQCHSEPGQSQCDLCRVKYPTWRQVFIHRASHVVGVDILCYICGKAFLLLSSLQDHHRSVHKLRYLHAYCGTQVSGEEYACGVCDSSFLQLSDFKQHLTDHKLDCTPFKCDLCYSSFNTGTCLESHKLNYHLNKTYICDICGKSFYSKITLSHHMRKTHCSDLVGEKNFSCSLCDLKFRSVAVFQNHMPTHRKLEDIQCDLCRVNYPTWEDVFSHRKIHQVGAKLHCYICGNVSSTFKCLQDHHKVVHTLKYSHAYLDTFTPILEYECRFCSDLFTKSNAFRDHLRDHMNEKNDNKCEFCYFPFLNSVLLRKHKERYHLEKSFDCYMCTKSFYSKLTVSDHIRKVHKFGGRVRKLNLSCPPCQLQFATLEKLAQHASRHTGKGEMKCDLCRVVFPSWKDVFRHRREHQVGKHVFCNICGKTLSNLQSLRAHHRAVHKLIYPQTYHDTISPIAEYYCGVCDSTFEEYCQLKTHLNEHKVKKSPFKCRYCLKCLIDYEHMDIHHQLFHLEKKFKCQVCPMAFYLGKSLNKHLKIHSEKKVFECCFKEFNSGLSLKSHLKLHPITTKSALYQCDVCSKKFSKAGTLKKHIKIHTRDEAYSCHVCEKRFSYLNSLQYHLKSHKNPLDSVTLFTYKCNVCDEEFSTLSALKFHNLSHSGNKVAKCDVCDRKFSSQSDMNEHKFLHTKEKLKCEVCGQDFSSVASLRLHKRLHSGEDLPECGVCNRKFANKTLLNVHSFTHMKEKTVGCDECELMYRSPKSLKYHRKMKHAKKSQQFSCSICDKVFLVKVAFDRHMRLHSGWKKYKCHVCCAEFDDNSCYRFHLLTHRGIPDFKCADCGKGFPSAYLLKRHLKVHLAKEPIKCLVCGKSFTNKGHLASHMGAHLRGTKSEVVAKKQFKCNLCGKIFSSLSHLKRHKVGLHK